MLRDLLVAIDSSPTASGLELRLRLGLGRETYEQLLGHLVRLGYLRMEEMSTQEGHCASGSCAGCPVGCQSSPMLGPQALAISERGKRYLSKVS